MIGFVRLLLGLEKRMDIKTSLPVGSVVLLADAKTPLMIFGIMQENVETKEAYDYIGVRYPEGNMGEESQYLFMHSDIDKILFRGYEDERREEFIKRLVEYYG